MLLDTVGLYGWVNASNYTSAGIIVYLYNNESNDISGTDVVFAPGEGHMNYYSCYT